MPRKKIRQERICLCEHCGEKFKTKLKNVRYCTKECWLESQADGYIYIKTSLDKLEYIECMAGSVKELCQKTGVDRKSVMPRISKGQGYFKVYVGKDDDEMKNRNTSRLIDGRMKYLHLTNKQVADKVGVKEETVEQWRTGSLAPRWAITCYDLAKALQLSLDVFFNAVVNDWREED